MIWIVITLLIAIIAIQLLTLRQTFKTKNEDESPKILQSFERIEKNFREDFKLNREEIRAVAKDNRDELNDSLRTFQATFEKSIAGFNELQREKFSDLKAEQQQLVANTEKRLEEIRVTVEEKLQKTLNERIAQSFKIVNEQLENVQKGLGEMQTLAQDVGGLKKVLSNVKTRGNIGEIQLGMLLEQMLAPEQYDCNVKTKKGSDALVEYAVKLPGKDADTDTIYLPIDVNFPKTFTNNCWMPTKQPIRNRSKMPERYWKQLSEKWPKISPTNILHRPIQPSLVSCSYPSKASTPR